MGDKSIYVNYNAKVTKKTVVKFLVQDHKLFSKQYGNKVIRKNKNIKIIIILTKITDYHLIFSFLLTTGDFVRLSFS